MCLLLKSSVLLLVLNIISMMALESSALSALFVETLLGQGKGPKIQKVFKESKKWVKNVMFLAVFPLRQIWIVNYYVKNPVKNPVKNSQ